jgi:AraC-like DNA-binding protein
MEQHMGLVVDQFAESLETNATNPPAAINFPLHYMTKDRAKRLEKARRELDSDREAADVLPTGLPFGYLASGLARLLEVARHELEHDREAAKASLATASTILQYEIERYSGAKRSGTGGLTSWQIARVRAFVDKNLHRTIHTQDLSAIARRSPAHFSRSFKLTFGELPYLDLPTARYVAMSAATSAYGHLTDVGVSRMSALRQRTNPLSREVLAARSGVLRLPQ